LASPAERSSLLFYLEDRFGIGRALFDSFIFFRKKNSWWVSTDTSLLAHISRFKISRMGLKAFQKVGQFLKPTTRMIQVFGTHATKSKITVSEDNLLDLQKGRYMETAFGMGQGYVILCLEGNRVLGLGLYVNGRIRSQISMKALRRAMIGA
jgi:NOL1/NOP2/fmu family ribosome biogenesis protein